MHSDLIRQVKNMGTVYLETFAKIAEMNDDPKKFYEQFGMSHSAAEENLWATSTILSSSSSSPSSGTAGVAQLPPDPSP